MKSPSVKLTMTKREKISRGPCSHESNRAPKTIEEVAEAFRKADPDGSKGKALSKKYSE